MKHNLNIDSSGFKSFVVFLSFLTLFGCVSKKEIQQNERRFEQSQIDQSHFMRAEKLLEMQQIGTYTENSQIFLLLNHRKTNITKEQLLTNLKSKFDSCRSQFRFKFVNYKNSGQISAITFQIHSCRGHYLRSFEKWIDYSQDKKISEIVWNKAGKRIQTKIDGRNQKLNEEQVSQFYTQFNEWNLAIESQIKMLSIEQTR